MNDKVIVAIGCATLLAASRVIYAILTQYTKIEYRDKQRSIDVFFNGNEVNNAQHNELALNKWEELNLPLITHQLQLHRCR